MIWAGPGDDVIRGGAGNDVICGNAGSDLLVGGAGDDRLFGLTDRLVTDDRSGHYLVGDTLRGGAGDDLLDIGVDPRLSETERTDADTLDWSASPSGVQVDLVARQATGEGTDTVVARDRMTVVGSRHDDTISGTDGRDLLYGGGGGDTLSGLGGADEITTDGDLAHPRVDTGDDVVDGGPDADRIVSDAGRDVLHGADGDDELIVGSDEPTRAYGDAGRDYLSLGLAAGSGWVGDGGAGQDVVALGDDQAATSGAVRGDLDLAAGTFDVFGAVSASGSVAGAERVLLGLRASWVVRGSSGPDRVEGLGATRLRAIMRAGDDVVYGSDGADAIDGGPGVDRAYGGPGDDVCRAVEHASSCTSIG